MVTVGLDNENIRIDWVKKTLESIPPGLRVLDAGAGEQLYKPFCSHLEYVTQDFCKYDGKGDSVGLQTGLWESEGVDIICDITKIPEDDASFDVILCTEVFEHLPEPIEAIREFARLLRKGGTLILTTPLCSLVHFAPYHYYGGFTRYFHEKYFPSFGFDIKEIGTNGSYFEFLAMELRRLPSIGSKYSSERVGFFEHCASYIVLRMIDRFAKKDTGSDELLNYGYHVRAVKV